MITIILLNEKAYAEECIYNKSLGNKPFFTLTILAKYYYYCFGYRKKKITELLIDFMSKYYTRYDCNKASWDENIEKIAKNAGKYKLFEIDGVWITKAEFKTIANIHNKTLERLSFTLLCLAKLGNMKNPNNNGWVNVDTKEIFSLARISCSVSNRYEKLSDLHNLSLLEFPRRIDNLSCRVTYINNDSENELFVSDFRELGYEYLKYIGDTHYTQCRECGRLFKVSKQNKKYCSICQKQEDEDIKYITCIDCNEVFVTKTKNNTSHRCNKCQSIRNKERKRIWYEKNQKQKNNQ